MSIVLQNTKCNCQFCGEDYFTNTSDAWSPFLYCSGECEVLDDAGDYELDEKETEDDEEFLNTEGENDLLNGVY